MSWSVFKKEPSPLDDSIDKIFAHMNGYDPETEEYSTLLHRLERLEKLKNDSSSKRPSPDAMLAAGSTLLGILIIVIYEQKHVLTSKGLGFILKPKI